MQRQNFANCIRLSRVLWFSLLVVMLGGLLKSEAATQTVSFGPKTDFATGSFPRSVAVGDFNGDGKLDLVVANTGDSTVSILLGKGTGTFRAKTDFATGIQPASVAVGDFNGDGKLDLAVANAAGFSVSILLGTGTGSFLAKTDFGTGVTPHSVAVGNFNGDSNLDLAVANATSDTVSILLGTGTGSFGPKTDFATGSSPESVAVGKFNSDSKLDLAVANFSSDTVSILLGTGTGSFGPKTDFATGVQPFTMAVGDFNGDGKLDLAVAHFLNTVSILLGTGTGSFGPKTDFTTGSDPFSIAVGDFNGDGKLDLATANDGTANVSILLGTGTGSFLAKIDFGTGVNPVSVAVGDFNGDGKLDLATVNQPSNTVSILLNTTPLVSLCQVSDLTPITDNSAQMFEAAAPNPPGSSLIFPSVEFTLHNSIGAFSRDVQANLGFTPSRESGFRPLTYQAHLYELRDKLKAVREAIRNDPTQETACNQLKKKIDREIDVIHGLVRGPDGLPKVNPPTESKHTSVPARAMDLTGIRNLPSSQQSTIDTLARQHNLYRPNAEDPVHFQLVGTSSSQTVRARVESPVNLLIIDPIGRKVGFDSVTASVINQIGSSAFYTGPNTEPQDIEIGGAIPGLYTVIGTGTGTGFYELTLERVDEDGELLETKVKGGTISPGEVVSLNINIPLIAFDICIQDENAKSTLQINTASGEYQFTSCDSGGFTISGTGTVTTKGSTITLQHVVADRKLVANIDKAVQKGNASVQIFPQGRTFTLIDRDMTNNTCACP